MENASKALIIAGSVFLALIVIGALVFMWTNASNVTATREDEKATEQLTAFNKQFESYQKQLLRGADIVSVINKVRNNNTIYEENANFQITWKFKLKDQLKANEVVFLSPGMYDESRKIAYDKTIADAEAFKEFKRRYFKCIKVDYSSAGRINYMEFEEISASEVESLFNTPTHT